jgi:transglutaminase-like putative cysteine protease
VRSRDRLAPTAEVALAVVTVAAVIGMHRLFADGSYRGPLLLQLLAAHALVTVARRTGRSLPATGALAALGAVLLTAWLHYRETTAWLLPTPGTLSSAVDDLGSAWSTFGDVRAPAPVEDGFLLAAGLAIWVVALVADWAAFRSREAFEALVPAATLFLFSAVLGESREFLPVAAVFAAAALGFVLAHRTWDQERSATWTGHHRAHGRWSLLSTGAALGGAALLAGMVAGPNLPGAGDPPVWAVRDIGSSDPTRVVVSPMVEMQTRLVEQPDVEVFTVRSDQPANWRLTALDEFDGDIWRSSYGTNTADGQLDRTTEPLADAETITQQFTIEALGSVWLPAAYDPVAVDAGDDQPVEHDPESSTLIVDRDVSTSDGFTYEVISEMPRWDGPDDLRGAPDKVPSAIRDRYLRLPDLDPRVQQLAEQLTAGAATPYDKALAIQSYLRTFTYDLTIGRGHSADALAAFLFETQRGYCEQFAGAFAALARSAGLPSRVAVGFTKGIQDPNDPMLFRVRGQHAHAWPEVYLGGQWVTFEPTPGRGPPGAERWLGVPEEQVDADSDGAVATTLPPGAGPEGDQTGDRGVAAGDELRAPTLGREGLDTSSASTEDRGEGAPPAWFGEVVVAAGVGLLAYLGLVPLLLGAQRLVRRRRAAGPADELRWRWAATTDRALTAGIPLRPSMTIAESAACIGSSLPRAAGALDQLARAIERVTYAEETPTADELTAAENAEAIVTLEIRRRRPWHREIQLHLDIRRLWQGPGTRPSRLSMRRELLAATPGYR